MIARVLAYTPDGATLLGEIPTEQLTFSAEVGGAGGCTFTARDTDLDTLGARDSLIRVELGFIGDTGTWADATIGWVDPAWGWGGIPAPDWTPLAAYTLRPPFRRDRTGFTQVRCSAVAVLEQWASEVVTFPEYAADSIPSGAGTERALGWQSTAYNPSTDPLEPWAGCYVTARTTMPSESEETGRPWPTGTNAKWVSITGASDEAERKLFRTAEAHPLMITTPGPVRVFVASDSPGTLYIAGEPAVDVYGGEPGKEPIRFQQVDLEMAPGSYAVAYDTDSIWDTGGDGVDPFICAICTLNADGDPAQWIRVTNATTFVACRRDAEPPDNAPPGPTPGQTLALLVSEAQDRGVSGWPAVTLGFTGTTDSEGAPWATAVIERLVRYGSDTLWDVLRMLSETSEVDTWMGPDLVFRASNSQGTDRTTTITLDTTSIVTMSDTTQPAEGTYAVALALDGWTSGSQGTPRREYGMEVGTAITKAVAARVVGSALAENGRWDASCRLAPAAPVPLVAFFPGDLITITYPGAPTTAQVLSMSATAGEGGMLWDLELAKVP